LSLAKRLPTVLLPETDAETADSMRLTDDFATTMRHELCAPLTAISGALGLLVNDAGNTLPLPMMNLLAIAHNNSQKLVRLVNSILEAEKFESGKVVRVTKRTEFRLLAQQAIQANRSFVGPHGVRYRRETASADTEMHTLAGHTLAEVERSLILATLKRCRSNRTHAAGILGISIRTLRNKLNEYKAEGVAVSPPGGGEMRVAHQGRSARAEPKPARSHLAARREASFDLMRWTHRSASSEIVDS
jgi:signal transduction histidine kinase